MLLNLFMTMYSHMLTQRTMEPMATGAVMAQKYLKQDAKAVKLT